jgi:ribosomal protein S11
MFAKFSKYLNTYYYFKHKNILLTTKELKELNKHKNNYNKQTFKKNNLLKTSNFTVLNFKYNSFFTFNSHFFYKKLKKKKKELFMYIKFSKNNVIISLLNSKNKIICHTSMGIINIKTKKKKFDFFSMILLGNSLGIKYLRIKRKYKKNYYKKIKGFHIRFETLLKNYKFFYNILHSFMKRTKLRVYSFTEIFKNAHNGQKKKRARRL